MIPDLFLLVFLLFMTIKNIFFSLNSIILLINRFRSRNRKPKITARFPEPPQITIQVPIYNDGHAGCKCIISATKVNYPKNKIYIQALDDSDDPNSKRSVQECIQHVKQQGYDADYVTRVDRTGFKAGNLNNGLKSAKGDIVAVFDSDSLIPEDFFVSLVDHFMNPNVSYVQSLKSVLNENENLITKIDAMHVDAELSVEQAGNNWLGYFIAFNGSGGMWRKSIIEKLGGWSGETLAEDRELSYKAYLDGYHPIYDPVVTVHEEVPSTIRDQRIQKSRWISGTKKCSEIYYKKILKSNLGLEKKCFALYQIINEYLDEMNPLFNYIYLAIIISMTYGFFSGLHVFASGFFVYGLVVFNYMVTFIYLFTGQFTSKRKFDIGKLITCSFFSSDFLSDIIAYYNLNSLFSSAHGKFDFTVTPKSGNVGDCSADSKPQSGKMKFNFSSFDLFKYSMTALFLFAVIINPASWYLIPFICLGAPPRTPMGIPLLIYRLVQQLGLSKK